MGIAKFEHFLNVIYTKQLFVIIFVIILRTYKD